MADNKAALLLPGPVPLKPTSNLVSRGSSSFASKTTVPFNPENYNSFAVKVPRDVKKRHSIMKFNTKVDVSAITKAHMQRQRNTVETQEDEIPKFGAGSEYGRDQRIEARRKKRGYLKKQVKNDDLPWLLKTGGRGGKMYKGIKEPNMVQNAAYFIFTRADDGSFEAYPVDAQYRFTPVINYRTLTADEAEEEFLVRNRTINYFSLMVKKRLTDTETEKDDDEEPAIPKVKSKVDKLQIYNDDDIEDMSNDEGDDDQEHLDEEKFKKAKKKLGKAKKSETDDIGSDFEEMEDGYEDSKELDYSENSSSDEEIEKKQRDTKPQAEDDMNARLNPDSEDDSELEEDRLTKGGLLLKDMLKQNDDSSDEDDDDDEEIDEDETKSAVLLQGQKKKGKKAGSGSSTSSSSRSDTPTKGIENVDKTIADAAKKLKDLGSPASGKKRPKNSPSDETPSKKARKETDSPIHRSASSSSLASRAVNEPERPGSRGSPDVGITEEAVRRYLSHKPMTTKDLLKKFKTKKTGLTSEQTVQQIAAILKKIAPHQATVKGKLYLSLKRS